MYILDFRLLKRKGMGRSEKSQNLNIKCRRGTKNNKIVLWIDPGIYGELVLKLSQENNGIFTHFDCHISNNWWQITTSVVK